ncbi:uncharacterized protein LOC112185146 [Rosa chinensis]|uniref:uncharacterized protein LOC112185146 n=1 Tax=Rosa chinensis TaxID=74649 RepID=UPI000D08B9E9|nr:uncharacterized protein LOC112185146 [Rosa chinensis]
MAYAYSDESNKHLKVHFASEPINRCPSSSCYTSSCSSSSSSSLDEPYDIDKAEVDPSPEAKQPDLNEPPAPVPAPEVTSQTTVWSTGSSSSQSPPQIPMAGGRPSGYDPNRLPSAMFAAKPSSAMDWSVASNESLFSIHVENNSFSRDQYFVMFNKSGELGKLDEMFLNVPTPLSPVTETVETKPSSNALVETLETDHHSVETESVETKSEISEEENVVMVIGKVEKDKKTKETVRLPTMEETKGSVFSHRSNESNHSNQSFQFPVLADHNDHHDHVKHPLEQVKEEKQEMPAPKHEQDQPHPESPERNAPLKATRSSSWLSCFSCCWICR